MRHEEQTCRPRAHRQARPGEMRRRVGTHRALKQDEANQDLLDAALDSDNLWRAWRRVKANKGAPGIDDVTIADFPAYAREHWPAVREQYYRPLPELDDWIRRRIRMCYWKQWRWPRAKIRHLLNRPLRTRMVGGVGAGG